jgi:membrane protease YdiL (CAAX protease family)
MSDPELPASHSQSRTRSISLEAVAVFGVTVGVSLAGTVFDRGQSRARIAFTDRHLWSVVVYELMLVALFVPWLRRRGWNPAAIAGRLRLKDIARGVGVSLIALACCWAVWIVFALSNRAAAAALAGEQRFNGVPAGPLAIVVLCVVNPIFEEFLWLGYGVARLADRLGWRAAAALSLGLRVAVHLYQGPWAILAVLPLGLAFTWYYSRTRRLWPVVVAHMLFDALGLVQRLAAGHSG